MKGAIIGMSLVLLVLVGVVWWRGGTGALTHTLRNTGTLGLKFIPLLLLAILLMGFVEALLPAHTVKAWLSDASGWRGIGIAWLAGFLTPAGSLMGLPLAAGLAKAGAGAGVVVTYMVSFATLSVVRLPLEFGIVGPRLALLRIAACLVLPPLAGVIARLGQPVLN